MNISELCIKRPVFAQVMSLLIIALGVICAFKLQIKGTPNIDPPIVSISANYPGADAEFMESAVTIPIEKNIRNVKFLDNLSSSTGPGFVHITAVFKLDADLEIALNDIRSKISEMSNSLPKDMVFPQVAKFDSEARPTLWISIASSSYNDMELTEIVNEFIKKPLEKLESVGDIMIAGGRNFTVFIEPSPSKLLSFNISPMEIEQAVRSQNQDYPAGILKTSVRDFYLSLKSPKNHIEEFQNMILKEKSKELIRIGDVAQVRLAPEEDNTLIRFNGVSSIALGITKQSNSNLIEMSDKVALELQKIKHTLPANLNIQVAYDGAVPVKASIKSVFYTIFEALFLVIIVIYLFLGSFRITIIPIVTIPISLIGTLSFMYWCGFSINTFTLLAMILAIGLVVDDAIVMLENIYRYVEEEKLSTWKAALKGSHEIRFAVVAMTITLASVFLPIGFIEGFVGKLFIEFAWTLAFSVIISGFVALTLTPMMASRIIQSHNEEPWFFLKTFRMFISKIQIIYIKALEFVFNNKFKFIFICLLQIVIMLLSFKNAKKEFMPEEDYGILQVIFKGPEGSTIKHTDKFTKVAEDMFKQVKEIAGYLTIIGWGGSEEAFGFLSLQPWEQRNKSQFDIRNELNNNLNKITGVSAFAMGPRAMGGSNKAIEFKILSTLNIKDLVKFSKDFVTEMQKFNIFQNIENDIKASSPTIDININKDKAYSLGLSSDSIGKTMQYLLSGVKIGDYKRGNEIYDIKLQYAKKFRENIADLNRLYVKNQIGQTIALDNIVKLEEKIAIKSINHYNNLSTITISADLADQANLEEAINIINQISKDILDFKTTKIEFIGEVERLNESNYQIFLTFGFALLFIFLILAAQFESFTDPLLILLAVPFSITGGVGLLYLTGNSLNLYSNIGLVTLIGLITKNSIMIVEFANQLKEKGLKVHEAILNAARLRLRPILMTTTATISGIIPLIFATGADSNARHAIGYVIIGGMSVGTIFTLFIIPLLYKIFKRDNEEILDIET